jgi:mono/diheme cytochrome c family protein
VLPADSGKTGQAVYEAELPETGPRSCNHCHAVWGADGPDMTKFKLYLLPGSPRDASNWLNYPAAAQARTIAFGKHGLLDDGSAYSNMAAYHKLYSRAEIERAVEYIRTSLEVVPTTIKIAD